MNYSKNSKKPQILIIGNNTETASVLRHEGEYRIRSLKSGRYLTEAFRREIPDMILTEVEMPVINGFDICRRLKQDANYSEVPVIFFTFAGDRDSIVKGFEAGAEDYILKSVDSDVLLTRIKTHIERKQKIERLKRTCIEMSDLIHMMSHDLKRPLWDIQKLAEYLGDALISNDTNDVQELLGEVNKKAKEAAPLIDGFSQLNKISGTSLKIEEIDMYKLTLNTYDELAANYKDREIILNCSYLPVVLGDKVLLKQVLINILSNAIKFTRDRKPALITVEYSKKQNEHVFSINDNGVGFDMKYSAKLFGMFQRMHSQEEFEGTGAGLAIVKRIIECHNGRVWIKAEPDKGASVSFTLPVRIN